MEKKNDCTFDKKILDNYLLLLIIRYVNFAKKKIYQFY